MKVRTLAGLGMLALAVILLTIFFLTYDRNAALREAAQGSSAASNPPAVEPGFEPAEADSFLTAFGSDFRMLRGHAERLRFAARVDPRAENRAAADDTLHLLRLFSGNRMAVQEIMRLRSQLQLTGSQDRQVEVARQLAALRPGSLSAAHLAILDGAAGWADSLAAFPYRLTLPGRPAGIVTLDRLRQLGAESVDPAVRRAVWECRQASGAHFKQALVDLGPARNAAAAELGYASYFELLAADLDIGGQAWVGLLEELSEQTAPLYLQLHAYQRRTLAGLYHRDVPLRIPADWLARESAGLAGPHAVSPRATRFWQGKPPRWAAEQADRLWSSLGLPALAESFWERSRFDLDPRPGFPPAEAWAIDLAADVRLILAGAPGEVLFESAQGAMGKARLYLACDRPGLPVLLRGGGCRAMEEAIAHLMILASRGQAYRDRLGWAPDTARTLPGRLLAEALGGAVARLPFAAGTLAHWQQDLYGGNLPRHRFNAAWWEYAALFQGIAPPAERGEDLCDPAAEDILFADPAGMMDEVLGQVLAHQLHRYICREILGQGVHEADYTGSKAAGDLLLSMMRLGRERDWRQVLVETTGEELSAEALLEYFAPLQVWLEEQNAGQKVGF